MFLIKLRNLTRDQPLILAAVSATTLYVLLFSNRVLLDITAQVQTLEQVCTCTVALPPTALFYVLTWLAALGQCRFVWLMGGALVVLVLLLTGRFWVTRLVFQDYFGQKNDRNHAFGWWALGLSMACSFPTLDWCEKGWYLIGQPSPNYWMNGTLIASWPFALVLFWQSYRQLQHPTVAWAKWMCLWLLALLLSKPSYAFVFAAVYPAFLLVKHGFCRPARVQLACLAAFAVLVGAEYYAVFLWPQSVYVKIFNAGAHSGVVWNPLFVWRLYSSNIPVSILSGVLFPLAVAITWWRRLSSRLLFQYTWAGFVVSLLVSAAFMQTGLEYYTWAFRFQHYIAAYLLFMVSALWVWEDVRRAGYQWKGPTIGLSGLFVLHVVSGLVYVAHMCLSRSHY